MQRAFTLIELLVVVLIIGILSAVALPQYTKSVEKSRAAQAQTYLASFITAQQLYKMDNGHYASSSEMSNLDLELPGSLLKDFKTPVITDGGAGKTTVTATVERNNSSIPYQFKATLKQENGEEVIQRYCFNHEICLSIGGPRCDENITIPWCAQPTMTFTLPEIGYGGED